MILYHNTSNANALKINKEGIIAGLEVDKYGKDSEAEGAGIWCTTIRGYGYGGATITFEVDDSDSKLVKQNDTEYILYHNVPVDNIIDIDLVIAYDLPSNIDRTDSINTTVESDITNALNYYGKDILLKVFGQNKNHFVEPYNYDTFENLLNTGKKYCKGTIDINIKSVNEGLILNLSNFQILTEARIQQLRDKTRSQTPKLADRADFLKTDYIGISKFGIFNFRTTSQTNPGKYWYQTIEVPNLAEKLLDEDITPELIRSLLEQDDIKLYCDDPSFLYWSFKYMAYTRNYGIEPEDRAPQRNNVRLKGALCKHLLSVTDLIKSGVLYEQMAKDAKNWMLYKNGEVYKNFNKARMMGDAIRKKNRINWENYDSYMNDYFASKAGMNKFLDDKDIKGSLKAEIERTAKTDPSMTLDDFISEEFGVDGIKGLAQELQIDEDYVKNYFKELGF